MLLARLRASLDSYIRRRTEEFRSRSYQKRLMGLKTSGLILDVGPSSRPFPFANVICDICESETDRQNFIKLFLVERRRKHFIIADVQHLPFKSKIFVFANCSHVLEHVEDPDKAFSELCRVAESVYVEVPHWFSENTLFGWPFHRWVFFKRGPKIVLQETCTPQNRSL